MSKAQNNRGASALGYGLIIGLISVVALGAITNTGDKVDDLFSDVGTTLEGVTAGQFPSPAAGASASASASAQPSSGPIGFTGSFSIGAPSNWADGAIAADCNSYLNPASGYAAASQDGVYMVDPDGTGSGNAPFAAYCDMTTDGGGWTLVAKQHSFTNISPHHDGTAAGQAPLLDTSYGATSTSGGIAGLFTSSEVMMWSTPSNYVFLNGSYAGLSSFGNCLCDTVDTARSVGVSTSHTRFAYCTSTTTSAFNIGAYHSSYGGVCGEVWCSGNRNGRYNGSCQNGNAGLGDWIMYVR